MTDSNPIETQWAKLAARLKTEGAAAAPELIRDIVGGAGDAKYRDGLLRRAVRAFAFEAWSQEFLDVMVLFGDAAVAHAEAEAEASRRAGRSTDADAWTDSANISCFNMAANLCALWGDGYVRQRTHHEKGLAYADRALAFRARLNKGDGPFSMAHWARGVHLLALGHVADAARSFASSLEREESLAKAKGQPTAVSAAAPASLVNSAGFRALAEWRGGDLAAEARYDSACAALTTVTADPSAPQDRKDEAKGYLDQLTTAGRVH